MSESVPFAQFVAREAKRIALLFAAPRRVWTVISEEALSVGFLTMFYVLPFALGVACSAAIGALFFNREWDETLGYSVGADAAPGVAVTTFFFALITTFAMAWVFQRVARAYSVKPGFNAAFKVAVFGTVPTWLAGMTLFFMPMVVAAIFAFVWSCVLYARGAHTVFGMKEKETGEFVAISLVASSMLLGFIGAVLAAAGIA
jgi:hypothetical protein